MGRRKRYLCVHDMWEDYQMSRGGVEGTTGAISAVCNGRRKTAYGYIWEHDFCSYGERKEGADNV